MPQGQGQKEGQKQCQDLSRLGLQHEARVPDSVDIYKLQAAAV